MTEVPKHKNLRVGFYGGMANNAYVAAKSAYNLGYDAVHIRDLSDSFPFSQPVWEDAVMTIPYDDVYQKVWRRVDWQKIEEQNKWHPPSWVVTPDEKLKKKTFREYVRQYGLSFKSVASFLYLRRADRRHSVIAEMQRCNALFVCGVEAEILAWCSGVPYVIWPHGGDIRLASGLIPYEGKGLRSFISYWANRAYLHMAYKKALWIGTHDCKGITGEMGDVRFPIELFPMPMPRQLRSNSKHERHMLLRKVMTSMDVELPEADFYFFIPSRISFFWKKTHLLFKSIKELSKSSRCHFIFSGWGEDYNEMRAKVQNDNVTFLPFAISKPFVFEIFKGADLVIDQFYLGAYGTAAVEAMSCNVPVMMYVETESFLKRGWSPPPALSAKDEDDVFRILTRVANNELDLEKAGDDLHAWFLKVHHDEVVIPNFYNDLLRRSQMHSTQFRDVAALVSRLQPIHERKI